MIFVGSQKRNLITEIRLGNDKLEVVDYHKYLGHLINRQLLDDSNVKQRHCDFNSRFNSVLRNFKSVSLDTFLFLFDSYRLPDYGLKCFETCFSNAFKRLLVSQFTRVPILLLTFVTIYY